MDETQSPVELSVIIPVGSRRDEVEGLHAEYRSGLDALGIRYELVYVLDGAKPEFAAGLRRLIERGERLSVVSLTRTFGEATAIMAGFQQSVGQVILSLPAYRQVDASDFGKIVAAVEGCDVAVGRRWPRAGGPFERARRAAFHGLLGAITGSKFRDLGCGVRAFNRRVLEEIHLYGDQHRFLAVIADRQGFQVQEVDLRQSERDRFKGVYGPRDYIRGFLDIFTIFFLVRFTKKPLRFFGMIGVTLLLVGAVLVGWLVVERLFFEQALADRPALLLSTLLIVLGLQLFALGLLGELIIFTHARSIKDYQIERVIHFSADSAPR